MTREGSRGGAVEARWAHHPKVVGSSPTPATKKTMRGVLRESGGWQWCGRGGKRESLSLRWLLITN